MNIHGLYIMKTSYGILQSAWHGRRYEYKTGALIGLLSSGTRNPRSIYSPGRFLQEQMRADESSTRDNFGPGILLLQELRVFQAPLQLKSRLSVLGPVNISRRTFEGSMTIVTFGRSKRLYYRTQQI